MNNVLIENNIEDDHYGLIYCAKNIENNKVYIGQTTKKLETRVHQHFKNAKNNNRSSYKNSYFYNSIRKNGEDVFQWIVLYYAGNKELLNEAEKYYIKLLNSSNNRYGYNLTYGGESFLNLTEEAKERWRLSVVKSGKNRRGKPTKLKGIKRSEEFKKKISDSKKGTNMGEDNPFYGKHISEETREKIIISNKKRSGEKHHFFNKTHPNKDKHVGSKNKIFCVENGKTYCSILEASKKLNIKRDTIYNSIKKHKKVCKKYTFELINNSK